MSKLSVHEVCLHPSPHTAPFFVTVITPKRALSNLHRTRSFLNPTPIGVTIECWDTIAGPMSEEPVAAHHRRIVTHTGRNIEKSTIGEKVPSVFRRAPEAPPRRMGVEVLAKCYVVCVIFLQVHGQYFDHGFKSYRNELNVERAAQKDSGTAADFAKTHGL